MKNKNGFVISTTLYGIFGIMMVTVFFIMYVLATNRTTVNAAMSTVKMCAEECGTKEDICGNNPEDNTAKGRILADNVLQTKMITPTKFAVDPSSSDADNIVKDENGLFLESTTEGPNYFFRGSVDNNYITFGKDNDGNNLEWRILRINPDGSIRIILNDFIPLSLNNKTLQEGDHLFWFYDCSTSDSYNCKNNILYKITSDDGIYIKEIWDKYNGTGDYTNRNYYIGYKIQNESIISITPEGSTISEKFFNITNYVYETMLNTWKNLVTLDDSKIENSGTFCSYSQTINRERDSGYSTSIQPISIPTFQCNLNGNYQYEYIKKLNNDTVNGNYDSYNNSYIGGISASELQMHGYGMIRNNDVYVTNNGTINEKTMFLQLSNNDAKYVSSELFNSSVSSGSDKLSKFLIYNNGTLKKEDVSIHSILKDSLSTQILDKDDNTFWHTNFSGQSSFSFDYLNITIYNIRPVINLNADVQLTGSGTIDNPYKVVGA